MNLEQARALARHASKQPGVYQVNIVPVGAAVGSAHVLHEYVRTSEVPVKVLGLSEDLDWVQQDWDVEVEVDSTAILSEVLPREFYPKKEA